MIKKETKDSCRLCGIKLHTEEEKECRMCTRHLDEFERMCSR